MCALCQQKTQKIVELARFLRENAPTIRSNQYAKMMNSAAEDLDAMVHRAAEHCQCTAEEVAASDQAAASPSALAPPFATPTMAGRSNRSCNI
jgi:hypothetical protein